MRIKDEIAAKIRATSEDMLTALNEAAKHGISVNISFTIQNYTLPPFIHWTVDLEIYHKEDL